MSIMIKERKNLHLNWSTGNAGFKTLFNVYLKSSGTLVARGRAASLLSPEMAHQTVQVQSSLRLRF